MLVTRDENANGKVAENSRLIRVNPCLNTAQIALFSDSYAIIWPRPHPAYGGTALGPQDSVFLLHSLCLSSDRELR